MDPSHPHHEKTKALLAKAVKMSKAALAAEVRALRKELMPGPLGKMSKVALINEYVNAHLMKEVERRAAPAEAPKKKREASAKFKEVAELMRKGHKMAEAWKMVKAAKPEEKSAAPAPAPAPGHRQAIIDLINEQFKVRKVARKSDAIRAAPHALEDAPHKQLLDMIRTFNKSGQGKKVRKFLDHSRAALVREIEKLREDGYTI